MNGAQDLGGMMGFGPVVPEPDEPVFHADWEARAFAITLAAGFTGQWNIDAARAARESLPPAEYLGSSYYAIWVEALERLLLARGMITVGERDLGCALAPPLAGVRAVRAADIPAVLARGGPSERPPAGAPRFAPGDAVRAIRMNPAHHTRLPRYLRGCRGRVLALRGAHVLPDSNARGLGESPEWLYTIEFPAREVWGPDTSADSLCADCWESYLAPESAVSNPDHAGADSHAVTAVIR